jgi:hypothetical protein
MNTYANSTPPCPLNALKCGMIKLETDPPCDPPIYVCNNPDCELTIRALSSPDAQTQPGMASQSDNLQSE